MGERKEGAPIPLEGEEAFRADMEAVEEEPMVLAPPGQRKPATLSELERRGLPASRARQALDQKRYELEKDIAERKKREKTIALVLAQMERKAREIDEKFFWPWSGDKKKLSLDAHNAARAVSDELKREESVRKQVEGEYEVLGLEEAKLLSAMQPDAREIRRLREEAAYEQALREVVAEIRGRRKRGARVEPKDITAWFDAFRRSHPEKIAEINAEEEKLKQE